jgi:TP901 family phage tail tape measure protein
MAFNINAQVVLSGPKNIKAVTNTIKQQLGNVNVSVGVNVPKNASQQVKNLQNQLNAANAAAKKFNQQSATTSKQMSNVAQNTKQAANAMQVLGKETALTFKRFAAAGIVTATFFRLTNAIAEAVPKALEFQRELVKIQQTTGGTISQLNGLKNTADELAKTLGLDANEIISVARVFAQTGQTLDQVESSLRAVARASLAPSFGEMSNTAEGLIAALAQFNIQASQSEAVLGSINAVSKQFAVESQDIIGAIRRTGGVFAIAATDAEKPVDALNQLIGIFTAVRSTTRESAETIATGLRTIFSRIQRPQTIEFLKSLNINLTDAEGNFVGLFSAFRILSSELDGIIARGDTLALSKVVEELGGIRQVGKLIPAIREFRKAEAAFNVAAEGATAGLGQDVETGLTPLIKTFEQVQARFESLIRTISESATFQILAKTVAGIANAFLSLSEILTPLLPSLTAFAALKIAGGVSDFARGFLGSASAGGGAGGAGAALGGAVTGSSGAAQAAASNAVATATAANTQALTANTTAITSINTAIGNINTTAVSLNQTATNLNASILRLIPVIQAASARSALGGGLGGLGGRRGGARPPRGFNRGGFVPGSGNSDTVPAMLTPGEFVIKKSAVQAFGADNLAGINKYAAGGLVKESRVGIAVGEILTGQDPLAPRSVSGSAATNISEIIKTNPGFGKKINRAGGMVAFFKKQGIDEASVNKAAQGVLGKSSFTFGTLIEGVTKDEAEAFARAADAGIQRGIESAADSLAGTMGVKNPGNITFNQDFFEKFDKGFRGTLFESVIDSFNDQPANELTDSRRPFDYTKGINAIGTMFQELAAGFNYIDAKISPGNSDSNVSVEEFEKKVRNQLALDSFPQIEKALAKKKAGTGAPGEFVVNKSSAQAFGYGNLNKINKYADGGIVSPVQMFQNGSTGRGVAPSGTAISTKQLNKSLKTTSKTLDATSKGAAGAAGGLFATADASSKVATAFFLLPSIIDTISQVASGSQDAGSAFADLAKSLIAIKVSEKIFSFNIKSAAKGVKTFAGNVKEGARIQKITRSPAFTPKQSSTFGGRLGGAGVRGGFKGVGKQVGKEISDVVSRTLPNSVKKSFTVAFKNAKFAPVAGQGAGVGAANLLSNTRQFGSRAIAGTSRSISKGASAIGAGKGLAKGIGQGATGLGIGLVADFAIGKGVDLALGGAKQDLQVGGATVTGRTGVDPADVGGAEGVGAFASIATSIAIASKTALAAVPGFGQVATALLIIGTAITDIVASQEQAEFEAFALLGKNLNSLNASLGSFADSPTFKKLGKVAIDSETSFRQLVDSAKAASEVGSIRIFDTNVNPFATGDIEGARKAFSALTDEMLTGIVNNIGPAASQFAKEVGNLDPSKLQEIRSFNGDVAAFTEKMRELGRETNIGSAIVGQYNLQIAALTEQQNRSKEVALQEEIARRKAAGEASFIFGDSEGLNKAEEELEKVQEKSKLTAAAMTALGDGLVDATPEEILEKVRELGPSSEEAAQAAAKQILASRDAGFAAQAAAAEQEILNRLLEQSAAKVEALAAGLNQLTAISGQASDRFATFVDFFGQEIDRAFSSDAGLISAPKFNPFENLEIATGPEIDAGLEKLRVAIGDTLGGPNVGATQGFKDALNLSQQFPQALKNSIEALRTQPGGEAEFTNAADAEKAIFGQLESRGINITGQIKKDIQQALGETFGDGKRQGAVGLDALEAIITQGASGIIDSVEKIREAAAETTNALNQYQAAQRQLAQFELNILSKRRDAALKLVDIQERTAKVLRRGGGDPVAQAQESLNRRLTAQQTGISGLRIGTGESARTLGTATSAKALQSNRDALQKERARLEKEIEKREANAAANGGALGEVDSLNQELVNVQNALNGTNQALDTLADDTTRLAAIQSRLEQIEKSKQSAQDQIFSIQKEISAARASGDREAEQAAIEKVQKPLELLAKFRRGEQLTGQEAVDLQENLRLIQGFVGADKFSDQDIQATSNALAGASLAGLVADNVFGTGTFGGQAIGDVVSAPTGLGGGAFVGVDTPEEAKLRADAAAIGADQAQIVTDKQKNSEAQLAEARARLRQETDRAKQSFLDAGEALRKLRFESEILAGNAPGGPQAGAGAGIPANNAANVANNAANAAGNINAVAGGAGGGAVSDLDSSLNLVTTALTDLVNNGIPVTQQGNVNAVVSLQGIVSESEPVRKLVELAAVQRLAQEEPRIRQEAEQMLKNPLSSPA